MVYPTNPSIRLLVIGLGRPVGSYCHHYTSRGNIIVASTLRGLLGRCLSGQLLGSPFLHREHFAVNVDKDLLSTLSSPLSKGRTTPLKSNPMANPGLSDRIIPFGVKCL